MVLKKRKQSLFRRVLLDDLELPPWKTCVYLFLLISFGTVDPVLTKRMTLSLPPYIFFVIVMLLFCYLPVFWIPTFYREFLTNSIPKEVYSFPKWKFMVMGFLDGIASVMFLFAIDELPPAIGILMKQNAIPLSMLASVLLGNRYKVGQYFSAVIILVGVGLSVIAPVAGCAGECSGHGICCTTHANATSLKDFGCVCDPGYHSFTCSVLNTSVAHHSCHAGADHSRQWIFIVLGMLATIPMALNGMFKEMSLRTQPMDVFYMNAWVALFQLFTTFIFLPFNRLFIDPGMDLAANLRDSARCVFTGYGFFLDTNEGLVAEAGAATCPFDLRCNLVECPYALSFVIAYLAVNVFYNLLVLIIIQDGGASLFFLASTLSVPLQTVATTLPSIFGIYAVPFHGENIFTLVSLVVILTGLLCYRLFETHKPVSEVDVSMPTIDPSQPFADAYGQSTQSYYDFD